MRVFVLLAGVAALSLAACDQKNPNLASTPQAGTPVAADAPKTPAGPAPVASKIDWEKARADLSKRPADAPVTVQAAGDAGPPAVPMLLPSGIVQTQSDRPVPPRMVKDGYFATYHLAKYDVTVNGSNTSRPAAGQAAAAGSKETMKFTNVEGGASLSFSRYGADYLIDFECRQIDGAKSCITEQEAKDFADTLFVAQTQ